MSFDAREKSTFSGEPWECYWWSCGLQNWYHTSGTTARVIGGNTYTPLAITRTEVSQNQEMNSGDITVSIPLDHPVALLFRPYLPPRPVSLVIYRGHAGESQVVTNFIGVVASCPCSETADMVVVPEGDELKHDFPALTYESQCLRCLFSEGCTLQKINFQTVAVLSEVSGVTLKSPAFAAHPDQYFRGGWGEIGESARAIASHVGDTLTITDPVEGLVAGALAYAYPGCSGSEDECLNKFDNIVNHLGFERIPSTNPFGEGGVS